MQHIDRVIRPFELADVFAQVLLISKHFDVDLDDAIAKKWLVWKRP